MVRVRVRVGVRVRVRVRVGVREHPLPTARGQQGAARYVPQVLTHSLHIPTYRLPDVLTY